MGFLLYAIDLKTELLRLCFVVLLLSEMFDIGSFPVLSVLSPSIYNELEVRV